MIESFRDRPYAEKHFREIVDHARRTNPFYSRWITDPENPPILDRRTALAHNDEILNGVEPTGTTSGSLGVPFRFAHDREWARGVAREGERFFQSIGGRMRDLALIYTGHGEEAPLKVSIMTPILDQIELIQRLGNGHGVKAITTYPTNAELLAEEILSRGLDMSFVERVGTMAETLQDFQKDLIRRAFPNARLWSTYSSMEFSLIAYTCPHEPDFMHIMARRLGVEILREDGSPAAPGETGQVFITDYLNRLVPLIRYELGDMAVRGNCPCGRTNLPALERVVGRVSGTLRLRDGSRVQYVDLSVALRELPGVSQYQIIQDGLEDFTIKLSATRNLDAEVGAIMAEHLGYRPERIKVEYVDAIPRGPNGKYRTAICNID